MPLRPGRRRARRLCRARAARRVHRKGAVHAVHLAHVGFDGAGLPAGLPYAPSEDLAGSSPRGQRCDSAGGSRLIVGRVERRASSTSSRRSARVAARRGAGKGVAPVPATSRSWSSTTRQSRPTSTSKTRWRCWASSCAFVVHFRILGSPPRGAFRSAPRARRPRPPISMAPPYHHLRNPKAPHNYPRERAMHAHAHVKMRGDAARAAAAGAKCARASFFFFLAHAQPPGGMR